MGQQCGETKMGSYQAHININIHYESAAQLAVKRVPERNIYIDEAKVLGIKQVSFEFRSEDCGRQIFVFQG